MFTRRSQGDLVYWCDTADERGAMGSDTFCAGVAVNPTDEQTPSLTDKLTLTDARALSPIFFFASEVPSADVAEFGKALAGLQPEFPVDQSIRFIWLENPNDDLGNWRGLVIVVKDGSVAFATQALFGKYALKIDKGATATWHEDKVVFGAEAGTNVALRWQDANKTEQIALAPLTVSYESGLIGLVRAAFSGRAAALTDMGLVCRRRLQGRVLEFPIFDAEASLASDVELDPLAPFNPARSRLSLNAQTPELTKLRSAFRCKPWPAALLLTIDDGARAVFTSGGGLGLEGTFALELEGAASATAIEVVCGLFSEEAVKLTLPAAFRFDASSERGSVVNIESAGASYGSNKRGRKEGQQWQSLWKYIPDYPIVPYGMTCVTAEDCAAIESSQLIPARESLVALANPPPPPPPDPDANLPVVTIVTVQAAPAQADELVGWNFPGTDNSQTIGTTAVFQDKARGISLELSSLPPDFIEALAFPKKKPVVIIETGEGLADARCKLVVGSETIQLDPRTWSNHGTFLVIRAKSEGSPALGATKNEIIASEKTAQFEGPLAWPIVDASVTAEQIREFTEAVVTNASLAPPAVAEICRTIFAEDGEGVALVNASGNFPDAIGKMLDGLVNRIAAIAPPAWSFACATPKSGESETKLCSALAASAVPLLASLSNDSSSATLSTIDVDLTDEAGWSARLGLRVECLLGHSFARQADLLHLKIEPRTTEEVLTVDSECTTQNETLSAVRFGTAKRLAASAPASDGTAQPAPKWTVGIGLGGWMKFQALPIDLLSFGGPGRSGMRFDGVTLAFDETDGELTMRFEDRSLKIDAMGATARANSIYMRFPLGSPVLIYDRDNKPFGTHGFIGVACDGATGAPKGGWCGLRHTLELGELGKLGGEAGLTAEMVVAWHPSENGVAVGLKLPGTGGAKQEFSLSGIARLGFRAISLQAEEGENPPRFVLRLEDMKLSILSVFSFPSGRTDLFLFGDDTARRDAKPSFGWFAAYAKTS